MSEDSETRPTRLRPSTRLRPVIGALLLGALLLGAAGIMLLGLGQTGLWTLGELPILDRTLAALGEPRSDLVRSPWLPDQLRTWAYLATGRAELGLRLPGALAGFALVALTLVTAWRLGWDLAWIALAGCFALALPLVLASARTALGNPTGELWLSAAVLALLSAGDRNTSSLRARVGLGLLGFACLGAAVASLGIILGACLPLTLVALADIARDPQHGEIALPRALVGAAWVGAAVTGALGLWLAHGQGEGYIPLLGAAKDLALVEEPTRRGFTDTLESFGYQLFPVTGLVVLGLLAPGRARWPALWLGVALVFVSVWSQSYGPTPTPVTIPAALLATAACRLLFDPNEPIAVRRLVLLGAILGALVLGKDAARVPQRIASPLLELGPLEFPAVGVAPDFEPEQTLPRMAKRFLALLLGAHILALPSEDQLHWRKRRELAWWLRPWAALAPIFDRLLTVAHGESGLRRLRAIAPLLLLVLALGWQALDYGRGLLGAVDRQLSIAEPLRRFQAAVDSGAIPEAQLGLHRIRDPGLRYYGPGVEHERFLASRNDLERWLAEEQPRTALIRRSDLPPVDSAARRQGRPLHVLDASHHDYLLVANFLPAKLDDQNPLLELAFTEPPALANPTFVAWAPYLELIAWEIEGPLHRGSKATLHMVFRVGRPLPAGSQLYARLQRGKTSRVGAEPQELTGGVFPPNFWRAGDYIHHRHRLEVPWLEVLPGEHELIVGLRRSEKTNYKITTPPDDTGESGESGAKSGAESGEPSGRAPGQDYGVKVQGKNHEFAVIGVVELAW